MHTVPQDSHGTFAMLKATVMLRNRVKAGDGAALTATEVPNDLQCNLLNELLHQLLEQNGDDWGESTVDMDKFLVLRLVVHVWQKR